MDLATMVQSLGADYVKGVTNTMNSAVKTTGVKGNTDSFDEIYKSALGLVNSTNDYIQQAQQAEIDFALGKITSTHELGGIQQKANLALSYTVAIRDKVLDAYKELMNMQI